MRSHTIVSFYTKLPQRYDKKTGKKSIASLYTPVYVKYRIHKLFGWYLFKDKYQGYGNINYFVIYTIVKFLNNVMRRLLVIFSSELRKLVSYKDIIHSF